MTTNVFQESEEQYQRLLEAIPDSVVVYDPFGNITYVNESFVETYGWSKKELIGKRVDMVSPGEQKKTKDAWERALKGENMLFETSRFTKKGVLLDVQLKASILYDRDGNHTASIVIHRDITQLKNVEKELMKYRSQLEELVQRRTNELSESEERYRLLLDSSPDAISVYDHQGKITYINPAFVDTFGWTIEELSGHGIDFVPKHEIKRTGEAVARTLKGENVLLETQRLTKEGKLLDIQLKTAIFMDRHGNLAGDIVIYRDITEGKQAEEALMAAKEEAEAANQAKSIFLANMSHELRTPLNAILGYAQILRRDKNFTGKQRESLETILSSSEHLLKLINDILDLSRIEAQKEEVEFNPFNLNNLINEVLNITKLKASEKELSFYYDVPLTMPGNIMGDEKKLRQILHNLLDNAVKYTEEGEVTLHVTSSMPRNSSVKNPDAGKTSLIRFEIKDTGIGIPEDKLEEIFEPFTQGERVNRTTEGTGLGLTISRRLIQLMGGELFVHSEVNKGSTFILEINTEIVEGADIIIIESDRVVTGYSGERKSILIVDDNMTNRSMLVSFLEPIGFIIETAGNGDEAIKKAGKSKYDLILLDLLMPVMDGDETLQQIRDDDKLKNVKIIGISAAVADKERTEKFSAACNDFLPKPVNISNLLKKIRELLNIEWLDDGPMDSVAPYPEVKSIKSKKPSVSILNKFIEKTKKGDFTGIEKILKGLEGEDVKFRNFCIIMRGFVRKYDDEGILKYLEEGSINEEK